MKFPRRTVPHRHPRPSPNGSATPKLVVCLMLLAALTGTLAVRAVAMPVGEEADTHFSADDNVGEPPAEESAEAANPPADDGGGGQAEGSGEQPKPPAAEHDERGESGGGGAPSTAGSPLAGGYVLIYRPRVMPPLAAAANPLAEAEPAAEQAGAGGEESEAAAQEAALRHFEAQAGPGGVRILEEMGGDVGLATARVVTADRLNNVATGMQLGALDLPGDHPATQEITDLMRTLKRLNAKIQEVLKEEVPNGFASAQTATAGLLQELEATQTRIDQLAADHAQDLSDPNRLTSTVTDRFGQVYGAFGTTREQVAAARKAAQTGAEFRLHPQPGVSVELGPKLTPATLNLLTTPPANNNWRLLNPTRPANAQPATPTLLGGSPLDAATRDLLTDHTPPLSGWPAGPQLLAATTDLQTTIQATTVNPPTVALAPDSPATHIGAGNPIADNATPIITTAIAVVGPPLIWLLGKAACALGGPTGFATCPI